MKITNTTKSDLGILPELVCPAGGEIELTDDQAETAGNNPVVCAWLDEGMLEIVEEKKAKAKADPKPETKDKPAAKKVD